MPPPPSSKDPPHDAESPAVRSQEPRTRRGFTPEERRDVESAERPDLPPAEGDAYAEAYEEGRPPEPGPLKRQKTGRTS